jgi:hypothetical protein
MIGAVCCTEMFSANRRGLVIYATVNSRRNLECDRGVYCTIPFSWWWLVLVAVMNCRHHHRGLRAVAVILIAGDYSPPD